MWKPIASAASTRLISTRRQSTPASRQLCAVVGAVVTSLAGRRRLVAADALAELFLLDPTGLHDHIEIVARDRHRCEQARVEGDLLLAAVPGRRALRLLACHQGHRG